MLPGACTSVCSFSICSLVYVFFGSGFWVYVLVCLLFVLWTVWYDLVFILLGSFSPLALLCAL